MYSTENERTEGSPIERTEGSPIAEAEMEKSVDVAKARTRAETPEGKDLQTITGIRKGLFFAGCLALAACVGDGMIDFAPGVDAEFFGSLAGVLLVGAITGKPKI